MDATITIPEGHDQLGVVGPDQRNLKIIREALGVSVTARGGQVALRGDRARVGIARRTLGADPALTPQKSVQTPDRTHEDATPTG